MQAHLTDTNKLPAKAAKWFVKTNTAKVIPKDIYLIHCKCAVFVVILICLFVLKFLLVLLVYVQHFGQLLF